MTPIRIGILGAESCGKTTLGIALAKELHGTYVAEYARDYVGSLTRPYTYEDVVRIAHKQCEQLTASYSTNWVFFDTELIITKVWFLHKYGKCPLFLTKMLAHYPIRFALLCDCDLPFVFDPLRENPDLRQELTNWYRKELELYHIPYAIVRGGGDARLQSAQQALRMASQL